MFALAGFFANIGVTGMNKKVEKDEAEADGDVSMETLVWKVSPLVGISYVDVKLDANGEYDFEELAVKFEALKAVIARENDEDVMEELVAKGDWVDVMDELDKSTMRRVRAEEVGRKWAAHLAGERSKRLEVVTIKAQAKEDGQKWMASRKKLQEVSEELDVKIAKANAARATRAAPCSPVQPV